MSYGKLNIWLRFEDCSLIDNCWRTDLVIRTCTGKYLVDMFPSVVTDLQKKNPDLVISRLPDYQFYTRINIVPKNGKPRQKPFLKPHIEIDVPPGCYIVWTRVCYQGNEETNKVFVIVGCREEACVNLILNSTKTCVRDVLHPAIVRAKEMKLPDKDIKIAANLLTKLGEIEPRQLEKDIRDRAKELEVHKGDPVERLHLEALELLKGK